MTTTSYTVSNPITSPIRIGVIGLGFMGATHIGAFRSASDAGFANELVAVCDRKPSRRAGELGDVGGNIATAGRESRAFDPSRVKGYERPEDLIADDRVDLVSVCTRTDTHVELCIRAMEAGKHVIVEKPVALTSHEVRRVAGVAKATGRTCMPAMCLRFWPAWRWLRDRIVDRTFGACHSATFTRLAPMPGWSRGFFADGAQSGGALIDLHIHDADFVRFCFGGPTSVSSAGRVGHGALDHVTTLYRFAGDTGEKPQHVVAEGGWDHHPGFTYRMRFIAVFDDATVEYDQIRTPQLVVCRNGVAEPVEVSPLSGYDVQARALLAALSGKPHEALPTLDEAVAVMELLEAERASVAEGRTITL
ncbi:MAG: Gfo/Idh/MocA family oxidoreductase [Tepidisphaeraceae bacterium]